MSRNLRLSSEIELAALLRWQRSPRSDMREAETVHRVVAPPQPAPPTRNATIYPLVALCRAEGLPEPVPEFQFHPRRKWRFDYAWPLQRVALEVEGGIWRKGGGAHSHPANIERDIEKGNAAALLGWCVLRYAPEDLGRAAPDLRIALARGTT